MDPLIFDQLLTPAGQEIISAAMDMNPSEADFLTHFQTLSRQFPPELARAGLEIAIFRGDAVSKFPHANKMYFTREALQQSSNYLVSTHRSRRYKGFDTIVDLCCSIGGDTLTLALIIPTIGIDRDNLRLRMAQENIKTLGLKAVFIRSDLEHALPLITSTLPSSSTALFFDPARRAHHRRLWSVEHYLPPLSTIKDWLPFCPALGVKISPGVRLDVLEGYQAEVEFVSFKGELKEAVLWFGPLKSTTSRANILPDPHTLIQEQPETLQPSISNPQAYFYEPDPAILRAGLVCDLGAQLNAFQLDPKIAYLTTDKRIVTPFARVWEIEDWFPFQLKRLRAYLRDRHVGQVVVKKRGSPLQPETLIRSLRLRGDAKRVIFLTQMNSRPIIVIGLPNDII